ncbi:hypothetical protein IDJ77_23015 [Mucilaginibacter sp. ZT4R22]|uniref:Nuclear transport factor 2 family protein n=1 Tax=Mucilaginibacter pankratovii TaxID=2772110 RepID=A0ABR7WWN8_9SPHI|nr:hypothetical protein [Mucilaginibacter pankratovii]MBD1366701.1 hypothetical protein [Mucilaginibacter pankratovii]
MKNLLLIAALTLAISACQTAEKKAADSSTSPSAYTVPEDSAITKAVHDAYAAISFKKGEKPRLDEIGNYFIPQAQLINFRTDTADVSTLPQFINLYKQFVSSAHIDEFYEEEAFGKTEQFGRVAHRISTYNTYLNTRDSIAERGVNSFQLIKTPKGWKVSSIIWDVEKKSLPVPDYYLKK